MSDCFHLVSDDPRFISRSFISIRNYAAKRTDGPQGVSSVLPARPGFISHRHLGFTASCVRAAFCLKVAVQGIINGAPDRIATLLYRELRGEQQRERCEFDWLMYPGPWCCLDCADRSVELLANHAIKSERLSINFRRGGLKNSCQRHAVKELYSIIR